MTATPASAPADRPRPRLRVRALRLPRPELAALLVLAAVLNLWSLDANGWSNTYYSAAVRSMASDWHAFLFNAFDAAGVMTVDKPPLALWVQALSVRAFGFNSWAILVPQALMGVATVALAYDLARRRFGRAAGFAAGVALATTPIAVAMARHNNPDALLALCSTAAVWFAVRALEDGRTRTLALAGVCVGLGFETKMGAALLVLPALAAAYLYVAPRGRRAAVGQLAAGGAAMAVVGLAWPVLVWLTPAADRPWVSGTSDNSIWSLILDYNGLGRIDGQAGGPGGGMNGPGGGGGGGAFGGDTGVLRLLNDSLGGQAGWLLGFAVAAAMALVVVTRLRRDDPRTGWLIAVGGTFATTAVAFSFAQGIFHPYYVSALAPFTALLVGAGVGLALRGDRPARILAPAAVAAGLLSELVVLHRTPGTLTWWAPLLIVGAVAGAVALAAPLAGRVRAAVVAAVMAVLLLAPATWAFQTLGHAVTGTFPAGGPAQLAGGGFGGPGGPGGGAGFGGRAGFGGGGPGLGFGGAGSTTSAATAYIAAHGGGTLAVSSQSGAAASIIASGADVAGIGGFSGRESAVTASWLAQQVRDGHLRWVLTDSGGFGGPGADGRTGATEAMAKVQQACRSTTVSGLYDCGGAADALGG